jgi:selenocysteine lyase/cysteine desulfurase
VIVTTVLTVLLLCLVQVGREGHRYLENIEEREEGGTPAIVGAIRAGLTFQLKAAVTPDLIMEREHYLFV